MNLKFFILTFCLILFTTKISSEEFYVITLQKNEFEKQKNLIFNSKKIEFIFEDNCRLKPKKMDFKILYEDIFNNKAKLNNQTKFKYYLQKLIYKNKKNFELYLLKNKMRSIPLLINNENYNLFKISFDKKDIDKKIDNIEFHINTRNLNNIFKFLMHTKKNIEIESVDNKFNIYFLGEPNTLNFLHFKNKDYFTEVKVSYIEFSKIQKINENYDIGTLYYKLINFSPDVIEKKSTSSSDTLKISTIKKVLDACPNTEVFLKF